jgi:Ni/Fe-hydrogenase subunit HybB-like protein
VRLAGVTAVSATVVALVSIIVAIGDMGRLVDTVLYGDISNPFVLPGIVVALYLVTTPGVLYFGAVPDIHRVALRSRGLKFLYRILSYGYVDTPGQRKEVRRLALGVAALSAVALLVVHLVLVQVVDGIADQPAWIEAMGKSSFVVNGLMAGVSISVILLLAFYRGLFPPVCARDGILPCAGRALLVALAVGAISFAWTTTTGAGAEQAWGDDNGPITLLVLVTGFVGPIAALAISGPCSHRGLLLASSLVLATTWVRMNLLVVPGLTLHEGAAETGIYLPTLSEWGLLLGYMAIFGMVILVLLRLLPFLSLWELDDGGPSPESREVAEA